MRNMQSIFSALPIVAASYGDEMGIRVVVGGKDAYTNGSTIVVPGLDVKADSRLKDVLWGYLSHESAHIKHTNFGAYDVSKLPPLGKALANLIEDVWIENALIDELPGTRFTMDKTLDFVMSEDKENDSEEPHPANVIFQYLWVWLRCVYREQKSLQNDLDRVRRVFDTTFPKAFCNSLEDMIRQRMPGVKSTASAQQLTKDILDLVKDHIPPEEKPEQPEDQQQSNQSGDGQSGQGQGSASDDGGDQTDGQSQSSDSGASGSGDGDQDGSDANDQNQGDSQNQSGNDSGSNSQSGTEKDSGDSNSQGGSGDQSDDSDQSQSQTVGTGAGDQPKNKACEEALNASSDQLGPDLGEILKDILEANADDSACASLPELSYDKELYQMGNVQKIQDGVLHASKLRAKLTGLVQSQQLRRNYETASGQHINTRRLDRVLSGDLRVFSHESPRREVNTDICLLLDSSSSMRGRDTICNSATASLALALGDIRGVDVCAATFPGADSAVGPLNLLGQPVRKNLGRFQIHPHGGTPLAEALLWSVKELRRGKRERKVVLVLTDGDPFDGTVVKQIVTDMEKSGIHLVGIGIQTNAPSRYFQSNIVINDLNDLGPKLFEVARRIL